MVQASSIVEIDGYKLLNNRYLRVEELDSGSFATIYKCKDCYVSEDGTAQDNVGAARLLSAEHLAMVQTIAKDSPEIEYVRTDFEDFSEEKKQAVTALADLAQVLPENSRYGLPVAVRENPRFVAIKKSKVNAFNDRDGVLFYALREAQILQKLQGQRHVCQLLDIYYSSERMNSISLVMEYLPTSLESLQKKARGKKRHQASQARESSEDEDNDESTQLQEAPSGFIPQAQVKEIMRQVLVGLAEMHEAGVWHRDLKVDNLMLDGEGTVKFIDFNISKLIDDSITGRHTKNVVTRNYRPPEIFFGDVHYRGDQVDTWSAGCVMAELLTNDGHFFPASTDIEQLCKIFEILGFPTSEDWPEAENLPNYLPFAQQEPQDMSAVVQQRRDQVKAGGEAVNPTAIDLVKKLLALNPTKRLLPREALQHPYFNS